MTRRNCARHAEDDVDARRRAHAGWLAHRARFREQREELVDDADAIAEWPRETLDMRDNVVTRSRHADKRDDLARELRALARQPRDRTIATDERDIVTQLDDGGALRPDDTIRGHLRPVACSGALPGPPDAGLAPPRDAKKGVGDAKKWGRTPFLLPPASRAAAGFRVACDPTGPLGRHHVWGASGGGMYASTGGVGASGGGAGASAIVCPASTIASMSTSLPLPTPASCCTEDA
jgi:hypothetical protein